MHCSVWQCGEAAVTAVTAGFLWLLSCAMLGFTTLSGSMADPVHSVLQYGTEALKEGQVRERMGRYNNS